MRVDDVRWVRASALFDGPYRYHLERVWDASKPTMAVCMLNPSVADADRLDPTLRRLYGLLRDQGYGGMHVVNLYALVSTDPRGLWKHGDPVGPHCDEWILRAARDACDSALLAWGSGARHASRVDAVLRLLRRSRKLQFAGSTHYPRHPLYLKRGTRLEPHL